MREGARGGIGKSEIWSLEIGRFLHLKAEIINLKLDSRIAIYSRTQRYQKSRGNGR